MRKYAVYLDDNISTYKVFIPADNEDKAIDYCSGNGDIIAVRDVTEDYPIDLHKVALALKTANFGQPEIDLVTRCLAQCRIAE